MRPESRQFVRRAQLLFLISILFPIIVLFISPDMMEKLGFVAVSSTANLVTDLPMIYELRIEETSIFSAVLFLIRALLSILAISLYLDFDSAPKDLRIRKTLFSLRLSKDKKNRD